jgi:hypothetical protein
VHAEAERRSLILRASERAPRSLVRGGGSRGNSRSGSRNIIIVKVIYIFTI